MRPLAPSLLAVLLLLPAVASAQDALARYRALEKNLDPGKSESVLMDTRFLDELRRQDRAKAEDLIRREGVLQDLAEFLGQVQGLEPAEQRDSLRAALRSDDPEAMRLRERILARHGLGPEPDRLSGWAAHYFGKEAGEALRSAMFRWDERSPAQLEFLAARGLDSRAWDGESFSRRETLLKLHAEGRAGAILEALRSGTADGAALEKEWNDHVAEFVPTEKRETLSREVEKRLMLDKRLREVAADPAIAGDGALKAMVASASDASLPLNDRLAALSRLFDRAEPRGAERGASLTLRRNLETPPARKLAKEDAKTLAAMLGPAWLAEVKGTVAGDGIREFYEGRPLVVDVMVQRDDEHVDHIGTYSPKHQRMTINARDVENWLVVNGRDTRDLLLNRDGTFKLFIRDSAGIFVHEATHHMQHAEAKERRLASNFSREVEADADFMAAAYTAEKWASAPEEDRERRRRLRGHTAYLDVDMYVAEAFSAGPRRSQNLSMTTRYAWKPGAAFEAVLDRDRKASYRSLLIAERDRRRHLSEDELDLIAERGVGIAGFGGKWGSIESFATDVRTFKSALIDELLDRTAAEPALMDQDYPEFRAYLADLEKRQEKVWKRVRSRTGGQAVR